MQLGQLQKIESELQELGYQLVAISPDKPSSLPASVDKNKLSYRLFSDQDGNAMKSMGIAYQVSADLDKRLKGFGIDLAKAADREHRMLPVPAVFIVGTDGRIHFQYVNPVYQVRLSPDVILAAAKAGLGK